MDNRCGRFILVTHRTAESVLISFVPCPQAWMLKKIPTEVEVNEIGLGQSSCPNDVGFNNAVEQLNDVEGEQTATVKDYLSLPRAKIIGMSKASLADYEAKKAQKQTTFRACYQVARLCGLYR